MVIKSGLAVDATNDFIVKLALHIAVFAPPTAGETALFTLVVIFTLINKQLFAVNFLLLSAVNLQLLQQCAFSIVLPKSTLRKL